MALNIRPADRERLREHLQEAIAGVVRSIHDPEPDDMAEAAMDVLFRDGIIRVPAEGGPDRDGVKLEMTNELDRVVLVTSEPDGAGVRLDLGVDQAEQLYGALPLHINAARSFRDAMDREV